MIPLLRLLPIRRLLPFRAAVFAIITASALWLPTRAADGDVLLTPSEKGIEIDAGPLGKLMLVVPELLTRADGRLNQKALGVTLEGTSGYKASYPGGIELTMNVEGSKITGTYSGPTQDAHGLRFRLHIPIQLKQGGRYAFGEGTNTTYAPFPLEYKIKQLHGARGKEFRFKDALGKGLAIQTPVAYQELQDNRAYNWQVYAYIFNFAFRENAGKDSFEIECRVFTNESEATSAAPATAPRKFIADRFGQSVLKDFSDKVTHEDQLKADIPRQKAYLESLSSPTLDSYGGLPDSGKQYGLKQTGYFHIEKLKDRHVMVDPEGNLFYSLGVCSLAVYQTDTLVKGRENVYEWLPPSAAGGEFSKAWSANGTVFSFYVANWMRKNGVPFDMEVWMKEQIYRLRKWGFNTGGIGTAVTETGKAAHYPITLGLPLYKWNAPGITPMQGIDRTYDPFADGTEEAMDKAFAEKIAPEAGNPNIIGYFIENEVLHENIGRVVPAQKGNSPSKRRLVQMLQEKYKQISAFNAAWKPKTAFASFDELNDAGLLPLTPESAADLRAFQELFLETHFSRVHRLFRKHDTNHLLLGSRWQPGTANHQEIVRIASKYTDVVSFNYYTYAIEPAFLKLVHERSSHKAMLMSEWNYTTGDQGLSGGKEVATQRERGMAYRNYVENT
ncbi:MAG TPA: beta-galactosidase, partial [Candidatus Methylacidiphilales bacterium]|nr:beta-galactosidase [Candidatus Methylacidiphilales bacterium]